jgi:hypothetical protein
LGCRRLERPIDAADWPVIDGLKTVGRLTYRDDDARALEAKLATIVRRDRPTRGHLFHHAVAVVEP